MGLSIKEHLLRNEKLDTILLISVKSDINTDTEQKTDFFLLSGMYISHDNHHEINT